jgi:4-diphosphocytidyl-2-C-methyl-D-erythritol kinase
MHVLAQASHLTVTTPAKLNLFLEVLAKRNDGFHEIETLMVPVNLYDTLYFRDEPQGPVTLQCEFSVDPADDAARCLPATPENLVVRAVELLRQESGCERGARMRLIKRIPIAAGLAGGSSDAAAALVAANLGWRLGYSREQLARFASQLGSDIPFFLAAQPAVCRGRGERIEPLPKLAPLHFVIVRPSAGLSTADVYRACRPAEHPVSVTTIQTAAEKGRLSELGRLLHNQLQPAARQLSPWIGRLEDEFARLDVVGHLMSGSGTSYFGLCRGARHARFVAGRLRARRVGRVFVVRACRQETAN